MKGTPRAERPDLAASYGISDDPHGLLPWSWAEERLEAARNYWVASAGRDGKPHASPVWGVWIDGAIYFGTDPGSVKGRNLTRNSQVVVHTESGDDPVIVHGKVASVTDADLAAHIDKAYEAKYGLDLSGTTWLRVEADAVLAWTEANFPRTATRFSFPAAG